MKIAGFWFLFWGLLRAGLYPWCAARMAMKYRNRWTREVVGPRLKARRLHNLFAADMLRRAQNL